MNRAKTRGSPAKLTFIIDVRLGRIMKLFQKYTIVGSPRADRAQFAFLVREFVSCFYPGTESAYGLHLFDEHTTDLNSHLGDARRRVWSIRDGLETVGFLVATRRLDGSVKLGPIVVEPGHRSEGYMIGALEDLTAIYCQERVPYLYATYPSSNASIQRLASSAGWTIAGAVRGLYRDDDEILIHRAVSKVTSTEAALR